MEPRASTPERRLETIAALAAAGVPTGVLSAPMIPALNDSEMEQILERARAAGAASAGYTLLRLPLELKSLFKEWLEEHFPDKAAHVLSLVAQTHGGRLYELDLVEADDRHRPLRGHAAAALRPGLPQARFQPADDAISRHEPVPSAAAKR